MSHVSASSVVSGNVCAVGGASECRVVGVAVAPLVERWPADPVVVACHGDVTGDFLDVAKYR